MYGVKKKRQTQFSDVDELKQFKYFFYVSCRFAEEKETLSEMINNQLIDDETMQAVAKYVLKNYPEHCLILLDGADEWKGSPSSETGRRGDIAGLPSMAGVEGCVILITSRPWRFHALSTKARGIFRLLKISGIKNVQELAYRILEQLDDPDPEQSSCDFLRQIREKNMSELMEIPLILIIALGGWVDDKSLHRSITVNYINMIQSFISRSKGQSGWSSSESKLRQLVPHLETLETVWGQKSNDLPHLLSKYQSIRRYAGLFLSLGQLAFDLLLGKEEQSLVFSKQVFKSYLPADDENDESVNVCLALGILSKTETTTRGLRKLESYAFCHKTFQEFFAALWLASRYSNEKSKLYKCLKSYRDLMSYEKLIIFLCGFNPEAGKRFWMFVAEEVEIMEEGIVKDLLDFEKELRKRKVKDVLDFERELRKRKVKDVLDFERELRKRKVKDVQVKDDLDIEMERMVRDVTDLVCKCMKEHGFDQKDQTLDQIYFCIPHIVINNKTSNEDIMLICHVMEEYPCNVKSLYFFDCQSQLQTLCSGLQSLKISQLPSASKNSDSEHSDSEHRHSVEFLPSVSEQRDSEHRDSEHSDSKHSDSLSSSVLDLQEHDKLETLELWSLSIEDLLLPGEGARITSLRLVDVTMSHHCLEQLSESLSSCPHLEYLDLHRVSCSEHSDSEQSCSEYSDSEHSDREYSDSCCIPVLDLQKHDKLETLELQDMSIEGLLLPVVGAIITSLTLYAVRMTHHGCEQLSGSVTSYSHLEDLHLERVSCSEHRGSCCISVLDLQKHGKLEKLKLWSLFIEGLLLPVEGARISSLTLYNVTMTHHDCEQLPGSVTSCSHLEELYLGGVSCREHGDSCCIPVLALQKHDKLKKLDLQDIYIEGLLLPVEGARITSLTLRDVTMSHHGCEQLSADLSRPEQENWHPFRSYASNKVICREHSDSSCQPVKDITNFIESHLR